MPSVIDPLTMYVDDLPAIWSPVQWELTEEERIQAINDQAAASLLWTMDAPEAILRLLLDETAIKQFYEPPAGYHPTEQGSWDPDILTFGPQRGMKLEEIERTSEYLRLVYKVEDLGYWEFRIEPEKVIIERI
ncbi:MAG: hypothetical protein JXA13_05865 [Anaerolineales bacterium]|nr:hypothetical protein [Anaerolineales bacterium]